MTNMWKVTKIKQTASGVKRAAKGVYQHPLTLDRPVYDLVRYALNTTYLCALHKDLAKESWVAPVETHLMDIMEEGRYD